MRLVFSRVVVAVLLFSIQLNAASVTAEPQPGQQVLQNGLGFDYWLYLPADYDRQKQLPLVIFLHGIGLKDVDAIKKDAPPARVDAGEPFPFILVSPFWKGRWWSGPELIVLIDAMAAKYNVDRRRIYVTGLSMGGFATWDLACRYPDRFAAVVPICGGGKPEAAVAMKDIPVWTFHGALDRTVRIQESEKMVEALRKAGAAPKFTIFPKAQHVCWPEVYRDPATYQWMLAQKRSTPAAIDEQAELRYALREGVRVRYEPIATPSATVGRQKTQLTFSNTAPVAVQIRGTLKAGGLSIQPGTFSLALPAGASQMVDVAIDGGKQAVATAAPIELRWTTTAAAPDKSSLTLSGARDIPIAPLYASRTIINPITLDGDLGDWPSDPIEIRSFRIKSADRKRSDQQASLWIGHDAEAIYVAVRVVDQRVVVQTDKPVWEQDGVELRLDFRDPAPGASFRDWNDVLPILLSPTKDGIAPPVWNPKSIPEGVRYVCREAPGGYVAEIRVPHSAIKQPWPLKQFRVNLAIDDRDEGNRVTQSWWHPDWRETESSDGLGTFQVESSLTDPPARRKH